MPNFSGIYINHHIAELEGVNSELLNEERALLDAAESVAQELSLIVVNSFIHRFTPHGLSLILVISQSHIAIHTWPEFGYMHLDIMTCSEGASLDKLEEILKKEFSPQKISSKRIDY